ncbi:hypothetical protein LTR85_002599 [Meristemomyces frigidus]|nr:hypothetical protein LTR85_002599 [Meristemomyces frigidus]
MHLTTAVTAVLVAFSTIVPTSSALHHVIFPRAEPSTCDATCMRRFLYQTAYASGAAGVGLVMNAYDSAEWCVSDDNIDWCPQALNTTVSNIAGKAMNLTKISSDPSFVCGTECLLEQAAAISRQSAIHAMVWAKKTVNGTTTWKDVKSHIPFNDKPDAVKKIDWIIGHLMHNMTSNVNAEALHKAMDAYKRPKTVPQNVARRAESDVDKKKEKKKDLLLGLGIPAAILGPFLVGGVGIAVRDSILQPAAPYLGKLLDGSSSQGVLQDTSWFKWLSEPNNLSPEIMQDIMDHPRYKSAYPELYDDYAERTGNIPKSNLLQTPEYSLEPPSVFGQPVPPTDTVKYWRSEIFDEKSGMLKQELWKHAPDLENLRSPEWTGGNQALGRRMNDFGYKPFRVLGEDGEPLMEVAKPGGYMRQRVVWQNPELLHPLPDLADAEVWAVADEAGTQMLLESAAAAAAAGAAAEGAPAVTGAAVGAAALDSMGMPIMGAASKVAGGLPQLMTLEPALGGAGAAVAGSVASDIAFNLLDSAGKKMVSFDGKPQKILYDRVGPPKVKLSRMDQFLDFEPYKTGNGVEPENGPPIRQHGGDFDDPNDPTPPEEGRPEMSTANSAPQATPTPNHATTAQPKPATTPAPKPATTAKPKPATSAAVKPPVTVTVEHPTTVTVAASTPHPITLKTTTRPKPAATKPAAPPPPPPAPKPKPKPARKPKNQPLLPSAHILYECTDQWKLDHMIAWGNGGITTPEAPSYCEDYWNCVSSTDPSCSRQ